MFVFHDRSPGRVIHLLINPIRHIKTVDHLKSGDIPLLEHMKTVAHKLLNEMDLPDKPNIKLGFHKGRCISIPHLHLHVLAGKPTSFKARLKYIWPFFKTLDETISKL